MVTKKEKEGKIKKRELLIFLVIILLISLCFFSASYFFNKSLLSHPQYVPFDVFLLAIPYFIISCIYWILQLITRWKKPFFIVATTLISAAVGFLLVLSTMVLPGSKNQVYVDETICASTVKRHYGVNNMSDLPLSSPAHDLGQTFYRWYAQQAECVDNFYKGKGPVFSENPPGFKDDTSNFQQSKIASKDFFIFSIPKPIKDIALGDLPNNANPYNVIRHKDRLWFAGDGSIIEYDTKSGKLVNYSNPKKGNCNSNIVIASGYLFTSCSMKGVKEFDSEYAGKPNEDLRYAIFKIDPINHGIKHIFTPKDGLTNTNSYVLYADGDTVWVGTQNGVGRINAVTNQVKFYTGKELGMERNDKDLTIPAGASPNKDHNFSVITMLIDKNYVWAAIDTVKPPYPGFPSSGGLSLYDKRTKIWGAFEIYDLKDQSPTGFGLLGIKTIPGGIEIGFDDGYIGGRRNWMDKQNLNYRKSYSRFVEKQYAYSAKKWTTINELPHSSEYYQKTQAYISSKYFTRSPHESPFNPFYPLSQPIDEYGLTQLRSPNSSETFQLDGRNNLFISPMIGNKRYLLTNATIDVIDDTSPFRQLLIKLSTRPDAIAQNIQDDTGRPIFHNYTQFLVEPETLLAVVIDRGFGGMIGLPSKLSIIDLKTKKIVKEHIKSGVLPEGVYGEGLTIEKDNNLLVIKDKNGRLVFNINATNYSLSF